METNKTTKEQIIDWEKSLVKETGMRGVSDLYEKFQSIDNAEIEQFVVPYVSPLDNMRAIMDGGAFQIMRPGKYTRLTVDGKLYMSDTRMERLTNREFVERANGRVLIAGLGVGLIIRAILSNKNVTEIIVVEKHKTVIDLVSPKFKRKKIKYIHADIDEWQPEPGEKFDTIYFDIWAKISPDNVPHFRALKKRFRKFMNNQNPRAWMGAWLEKFCLRQYRQEMQESKNQRLLDEVLGGKIIGSL